MRVGVFQFDPEFGQVEANVRRVVQRLRRVRADLVVLPECFNTGYPFASAGEAAELAEEVPRGETTQRLLELAREARMHLVAGLVERAGGRLYNTAVLVRPDGAVNVYRKTHLFADEKRWFTPGETGFRVFPLDGVRVGLMICFDWIFPEAARSLALRGADILCHPANLVLPYCPAAMVTRCLENGVFALTANRIGTEERGGLPRYTFIGQSQIVGPRGDILARASEDREELLLVDIDPARARDKAITPQNHLLEDRRPEAYAC